MSSGVWSWDAALGVCVLAAGGRTRGGGREPVQQSVLPAAPPLRTAAGQWGLDSEGHGSAVQMQLFTLLFSFAPAQSNQDCCLSYSKGRLPRWALKGYTEQLSSEVCDIHAIM